MLVFSTLSFVICTLPCCHSSLLSGSPLPLPLPCVNRYMYSFVHMCNVWWWGDKALPWSPFPGHFSDDDTLLWLLWVLSFYVTGSCVVYRETSFPFLYYNAYNIARGHRYNRRRWLIPMNPSVAWSAYHRVQALLLTIQDWTHFSHLFTQLVLHGTQPADT
jgi:hypothetical protein